MKHMFILMFCGFFTIHPAIAEDSQAPTPTVERSPAVTQQWLELQRSGKAASTQAQPISGEVMDKVHNRYLKSFEKPIPEYYEHATTTSR